MAWRLRGGPMLWANAGVLALLLFLAFLGPVIGGLDALAISTASLRPPSGQAWLGTDELGRDVLVQLMYGGRTSLTVGIIAALSATVIGIGVGALSGFASERVDTAIMRVTEIFQVMPTFILAAVIVSLMGPGTTRVVIVIALLSWPAAARLMRGEVLRIRGLGYVDAARCLGLSESRILWREVVPNAVAPVIPLATLTVGQAILIESALAYFGLTSPDVASWGKMLNSGQRFVYQAWWLSIFPGMLIFITVLSFNLLGDKLTEIFNPRSDQAWK